MSFSINGVSANWHPSDTEIWTRVGTINDADATDRLGLAEYKDEVTKNKKWTERVEVNGKVMASKTCRLEMQMLTVKLFDFRVVNAVSG
jgi:hypothetical protein